METLRSKKVFFISECLLNQNLRAYGVGNMKGQGPVSEIVETLTKNGFGFSVVECPEVTYEDLKRNACGKTPYNNEQYRKICNQRAQELINRYKLYLDDDYKVGGFICVNGSPSCACDYCYDGEDGHTKILEPGVFIEEVQKQLKDNNLSLKFIGIRMKKLPEALEEIKSIILQTNK
jgi:predicted secreted protein